MSIIAILSKRVMNFKNNNDYNYNRSKCVGNDTIMNNNKRMNINNEWINT